MQFTSVKKTSKCKKIVVVLILFLVLLGISYGAWQYYSAFGLTMPSIDKVKVVSIKAEDSLVHQYSLTNFLKALRKRIMTNTDSSADSSEVVASADAVDDAKSPSEQRNTAAKEPVSKIKATRHTRANSSALVDEAIPNSKIAYAKIKITIEKERSAYEMEKPTSNSLIKKSIDSIQKKQTLATPAKHEDLSAQPADYSVSKQPPAAVPVPVTAPASKQGQDLRALLQKVQRSSENQQVQRMQNAAAKTNFSTTTTSNNNTHLGVNNYPAAADANTQEPVQEPIVMINNNEDNGGAN